MTAAPSSIRRTAGVAIWAVSAAIGVAWLVEAFTIGLGFISTHLAPFAIVGNLVGLFLMRKGPAASSADKK
jgi:hypothetical protein